MPNKCMMVISVNVAALISLQFFWSSSVAVAIVLEARCIVCSIL